MHAHASATIYVDEGKNSTKTSAIRDTQAQHSNKFLTHWKKMCCTTMVFRNTRYYVLSQIMHPIW